MPKMSVPEAAASLGVSPARIRQRIDEGSLIAEKIGGRWLVDLSTVPEHKSRGRRVKPELIWDAIRRLDLANELHHDGGRTFEECLRLVYHVDHKPERNDRLEPDLVMSDGKVWEIKVAPSSSRRALLRLLDVASSARSKGAPEAADALLRWLGDRAERRLFRVAQPDLVDLREDSRLLRSGLSHPRSGMQDTSVIEAYVASGDLDSMVEDYWLDPPKVDVAPNVFMHVAEGRPREVSPLMLAADLWEHEGPRERGRARELVAELFS